MVLFMSMAMFQACESINSDTIVNIHPKNIVTYKLYYTDEMYRTIDKYTYETEDQCMEMYKERNAGIIQIIITDKGQKTMDDTQEAYHGNYFDF